MKYNISIEGSKEYITLVVRGGKREGRVTVKPEASSVYRALNSYRGRGRISTIGTNVPRNIKSIEGKLQGLLGEQK